MKVVVKAIVKNTDTWVHLETSEVDMTQATEDEVRQGVVQFKDIVATSFKEGADGYLSIGDTIINVQAYAAISIEVV